MTVALQLSVVELAKYQSFSEEVSLISEQFQKRSVRLLLLRKCYVKLSTTYSLNEVDRIFNYDSKFPR